MPFGDDPRLVQSLTTARTTLGELGMVVDEVTPSADGTHGALKDPFEVVGMSRNDLIALSRGLPAFPGSGSQDDRSLWATVLGEVACSCARNDDYQVVCCLLRVARRWGLDGPSLALAFSALLDQQQPSGLFGLFGPEAAIGGPTNVLVAQIALTCEVIRAIEDDGRPGFA